MISSGVAIGRAWQVRRLHYVAGCRHDNRFAADSRRRRTPSRANDAPYQWVGASRVYYNRRHSADQNGCVAQRSTRILELATHCLAECSREIDRSVFIGWVSGTEFATGWSPPHEGFSLRAPGRGRSYRRAPHLSRRKYVYKFRTAFREVSRAPFVDRAPHRSDRVPTDLVARATPEDGSSQPFALHTC